MLRRKLLAKTKSRVFAKIGAKQKDEAIQSELISDKQKKSPVLQTGSIIMWFCYLLGQVAARVVRDSSSLEAPCELA